MCLTNCVSSCVIFNITVTMVTKACPLEMLFCLMFLIFLMNPYTPGNLKWYSPFLDLVHTIQVCSDERVNTRTNFKSKE